MQGNIKRVIRVLQLDPLVYSEIERERRTIIPAVILVILSSLGTGIGSTEGYIEKIPLTAFTAFLAWVAWSLFIYVAGSYFFPEPGTNKNLPAVFRATAFASAPGLFKALAFFPAVSGIMIFGVTIWTIGATVIATKEILHYDSMPRAITVSVMGWICSQWVLFQI